LATSSGMYAKAANIFMLANPKNPATSKKPDGIHPYSFHLQAYLFLDCPDHTTEYGYR